MKSKLHISTKLNNHGKTVLDQYFVQPPFKLMSLPNNSAWDTALTAMQMSSSPGLLAGDDLSVEIALAANTRLILTTQAFTRVQSMDIGKRAIQSLNIHLDTDSRLYYVPHPLVLHKDSALEQRTDITMRSGSQLIFAEVIAIGRAANGERFEFSQFSSHLTIHEQHPDHSTVLLSDCIQWHPKLMDLTAIGQMEDYSHQGMLLFIHIDQDPADIAARLSTIQGMIDTAEQDDPQLLIGASLIQAHGFVVRALGHNAQSIEQLFARIGQSLQAD